VIGQGVMFAQLKVKGATNAEGGGVFLNDDQWDGYQPARDRIFAALGGTDGGAPVRNAVILTGDIHSAWAADLTPDPNNADVASGGYNPRTGAGSVAVEFVATSVTSAGIPDPDGTLTKLAKSQNPHFKHVDLLHHGYMLLDVTPQRLSTEFWSLATVESPDTTQTLSAVWQVKDGAAHLSAGSPSTPPAQTPAPAP
jgi:alkaline phosphatase D